MASKADTPLSLAFFSKMNTTRIQSDITNRIYSEISIRTEAQNEDNLRILMKSVFSKAFVDPYTNISSQVSDLNSQTVKEAVAIMKPNILQEVTYQNRLGTLPPPAEYPGNTSTYGKKIPYNTRIGFQ
jgi:plasmid maintenance system killer protein